MSCLKQIWLVASAYPNPPYQPVSASPFYISTSTLPQSVHNYLAMLVVWTTPSIPLPPYPHFLFIPSPSLPVPREKRPLMRLESDVPFPCSPLWLGGIGERLSFHSRSGPSLAIIWFGCILTWKLSIWKLWLWMNLVVPTFLCPAPIHSSPSLFLCLFPPSPAPRPESLICIRRVWWSVLLPRC